MPAPPEDQAFVSWHAAAAGLDERATAASSTPSAATPPFAIRADLNRKLVVTRWSTPWTLQVEALVISNNEALSDRSGLTGELFRQGGAALETAVAALGTVRTGEARLTASPKFVARHAIHAIGPRYQAKYASAADTALHSAYRAALQLCREHAARTVAFAPLHDLARKAYPSETGAHVALRTIRKQLERHAEAFDVIVLLMPTDEHLEAYGRCMPLYFPRTDAELLRSADALASIELGDAEGEVCATERRIRVARDPTTPTREGVWLSCSDDVHTDASAVPGSLVQAHSQRGFPPASPGMSGAAEHGGRAVMEARGLGGDWAEDLAKGSASALVDFRAVSPSPDERHAWRAGASVSRLPAPGASGGARGQSDGARPQPSARASAAAGGRQPTVVAGEVHSRPETCAPGKPGSVPRRRSGGGGGGGGGQRQRQRQGRDEDGDEDGDEEVPWWKEWWEEWMEYLDQPVDDDDDARLETEHTAGTRAEVEAAMARARANGRSGGGTPRHVERASSGRYVRSGEPDATDSDDGAGDDEEEARALYACLVQQASVSNLDGVASREMVYRAASDRSGRANVVLVGSRLHAACTASTATREAVALLLIRELQALAAAPFGIVFLATALPDDCGPTFDFLRTLLLSLPMPIHKRIRAFYLVHPSLKMRFTFGFLGAALWGKLHFVDDLRQLHRHFVPGSLLVPESVAVEDERRQRRLQRLAGTGPRQPVQKRAADPAPASRREQSSPPVPAPVPVDSMAGHVSGDAPATIRADLRVPGEPPTVMAPSPELQATAITIVNGADDDDGSEFWAASHVDGSRV